MTKHKLINTDVKLGQNTLLLEALESLGIDFPIARIYTENFVWIKWNSGILEQWVKLTGSGNSISATFPIPFVDTPRSIATGQYVAGQSASANLNFVGNSNRETAFFYVRNVSTGVAPEAAVTIVAHSYSVGRWK